MIGRFAFTAILVLGVLVTDLSLTPAYAAGPCKDIPIRVTLFDSAVTDECPPARTASSC